jgi:signal transduction histidine kinase
MREMEGRFLRSEVYLSEANYLEKALEIIKADLAYDHVNIFRLDKYNQELICVAGACERGKRLARENYRVNVVDQESIIGHVIQTEEIYLANDVLNDPHYLALDAFPDTRAELVVPIRVRNRLYGVLDIEVHQAEYFLPQDQKAIEILANYVGWVIDNSEQFQHISWVNRIVETIAAPIFTQNHLDETLQEIADSALEELQADLVILYSYDRSIRDGLSGPLYAGHLFHPELIAPTPINTDNVVFRLVEGGERIYIHEDLEHANLNEDPLFKPSPRHLTTGRQTFIEREQIRSHVIIRLLNHGQCVGVLFLNFRKPRTFTEWEKKRYYSFAHLAALAIQKMQSQQHVIQKEKAELSNLVHDMLIGDTVGLFKVLRSIDFSAENGSQERAKKGVALAMEAAEHLHHDIRWINRVLKENYSEDLKLELDKLFMLFRQVFNVDAQVKWSGDAHLISPALSRELFIVMREALTNAVRHGKAQKIIITIAIKLNELSATINDDGVGFNPKLVKRMSGLLSMKYRIEELAGTFKLSSNPGKGTKIAVRVPLQNAKAGV